jgi:hypothetical protein
LLTWCSLCQIKAEDMPEVRRLFTVIMKVVNELVVSMTAGET